MAEMSLKRRKSSIQPTNQWASHQFLGFIWRQSLYNRHNYRCTKSLSLTLHILAIVLNLYAPFNLATHFKFSCKSGPILNKWKILRYKLTYLFTSTDAVQVSILNIQHNVEMAWYKILLAIILYICINHVLMAFRSDAKLFWKDKKANTVIMIKLSLSVKVLILLQCLKCSRGYDIISFCNYTLKLSCIAFFYSISVRN